MASRQIIHSNPVLLSKRSEALLWSLQNFTQDFLAESLIHDSKAYERFLNSNKISFRISDWISTPQSPHRHVHNIRRASVLSKTPHKSFQSLLSPGAWTVSVPLQSHISMASAYSTTTTQSTVNPLPIIKELKEIISTDTAHLRFRRLAEIISEIIETNDKACTSHLLKERRNIYAYLTASTSRERLTVIDQIFSSVPPKRRTKYDFAARIRTYVEIDSKTVESIFRESLSHIAHKSVLELLYSTFKHIYSIPDLQSIPDPNYYCLNLYQSVLLKQLGTLKLLDKDLYKTERIILHFLMKKNTQLTTLLRRLMIDKPAFAQMLATTCLDIEHFVNNHSNVIDIWRVKEDLKLCSSFDLFRAMGSYSQLKDYDAALRIYERNPDLHADWLFDIVLKTYALKEDWAGMQRVFEGLFGRGELPNIKHYRIVMDAISKIAGVDIVDFMYENIKARNLKPTIEIHNSLMYARYALGDVKAVRFAMERMKDDGLKPNERSYLILLLLYRDSGDINAAMKVLETMMSKDMKVSRSVLTTVLSLCTERKDPMNAEKAMEWIVQMGHGLDITCYNTLLKCYTDSNYVTKATDLFAKMKKEGLPLRIDTVTIMFQFYARKRWTSEIAELYQEMSRLQILPDAKFYSVMLEYLVSIGKFAEAEQMLVELESTAIGTNIFHYTILMKGYLLHGLFPQVMEVYERIEAKKLTPTFETIALLIECLQRDDRDYGINGVGEALLDDYLSGERRLDLTSKYLPRNILIPEMYKAALHGHARRGEADKAEALVEKLKQNGGENDLSENTIILRKLAEVYGMSGQWDNFDKYWNLLRETLTKQYVPVKVDEDGQDISAIPRTERFSNDKVFRLKFQEMMQFGEIQKIIPLILKLEQEGFQLSNTTHNYVVSLLSTEDSTLEQCYEFAERRLLHGNLKRMHAHDEFKLGKITADSKRKLIGYYTINFNSISVLVSNFERLLSLIGRDKKLETEAEALQLYREEHPRMAKFLLRELKKPRFNMSQVQYY